jgi:hypothetical protein
MESCKHFEYCSANVCARDADIHLNTWFIDEDIRPLREFRDLPVIRRQRQLMKRRPPSLIDKLLSYDYLVKTAPKKRVLSPEAKGRLMETGKRHQFGENCLSECREIQAEKVGQGHNRVSCGAVVPQGGMLTPGNQAYDSDMLPRSPRGGKRHIGELP